MGKKYQIISKILIGTIISTMAVFTFPFSVSPVKCCEYVCYY